MSQNKNNLFDTKRIYGFRKSKAFGLSAALLGSIGFLLSGTVSAEEVNTGRTGLQDTPISRADISTLTEDQKARVVEGQITDVDMSWLNTETGNVEWVTDFVLVYQPTGNCSVVPSKDVTPSVADVISNVTGVKKETITKVLPNTGEVSASWMVVAGVGLAGLGGYLAFRNSRTGKTMLVAVLVAGGVGLSSTAFASGVDFLKVIDTVSIKLEGSYSHTAAVDPDGCWEYVGYIPEIASVPKEVPVVPENPSVTPPTPEVPVEKVTTVWVTDGGEVLRTREDGTLVPDEFNTYKLIRTEVDDEGNTTHVYRRVLTNHVDVTDLHEVSDQEKGTTPKKDEIPEYEYTGRTTVDENGDTTHYYRKVVKGNVVVNYVTVDGEVIKEPVEDTPLSRVDTDYDTAIDNKPTTLTYKGIEYRLVRAEGTEVGKVVEGTTTVTYVYRPVVTNHVEEGTLKVLSPQEKGTTPDKVIETYTFTGKTTVDENGDTTHYYRKDTTRELDPVEVKGNVVVHYVDTEGNTIATDVPLVTDSLVSTTYRTELTQGDKVTVSENTVATGATYDTTGVKPQTIQFGSKTYELVQLKDGDKENGTIVEGTTHVTYIYRHVPQVTTREEKIETKGTVIVHYVDEEGNTIKDDTNLFTDELVSTKTITHTITDGVETGSDEAAVFTGTTYDTTTVKPETIDFNGSTYTFSRLDVAISDMETGVIPEGVTEVTYVYKRKPVVSTTEETSQVKGNVIVRYVDTKGNEIKTPNNLVTDGIVSNTKTIITLADGVETSRSNETTPTNLMYDTVPVKDATIDYNGKTYTFKQVKEGDVENDLVVEGTTTITYIYDYVPPVVETREETSQVKGNVIIKYVDTNGTEIKDPYNLVTDGVVSNTTTTITTTDGVETDRQTNTTPTNLRYDTTTQKPATIEFNSKDYVFKELKQGDVEQDKVVEGTTVITYIYDLAPTTTEVTTREVTGNVITRYINEVTGEEIVTGSNIVTNGVVATETTTTVKDSKGNIVSTDTVRTPTGLTYDTTTDKAAKDQEVAVLRTAPLEYVNGETGEIIQAGTPVYNKSQFVRYWVIDPHAGKSPHPEYVAYEKEVIASGGDLSKVTSSLVADLVNKTEDSKRLAAQNGYDVNSMVASVDTNYANTSTAYYVVTFTKQGAETVPQAADVPYEFTRVDTAETGEVEEGTKVITYYYRPSKATWVPTTTVDDIDFEALTVATLA